MQTFVCFLFGQQTALFLKTINFSIPQFCVIALHAWPLHPACGDCRTVSSVCKDDVSSSVPASLCWRQAGKVCAVYLHRLPCQRVNKGHPSISFQAATLFAFPQPPRLPETGGRRLWLFLPISSRAWHEQLNLGPPCGLWIKCTVLTIRAQRQTTTTTKRFFFNFLFLVYPSGHCLPYHWRGPSYLIACGNRPSLFSCSQSDCPVMDWTCRSLPILLSETGRRQMCPSDRLSVHPSGHLSVSGFSILSHVSRVCVLSSSSSPPLHTLSFLFLDFPVRPFPCSFQPEWFPRFLPL